MRTLAERIDLTNRKLQKRVRLLHIFGARQGTLYQNQREKLDVSFGYMRDGNVTQLRTGQVSWKDTRSD